MVAVIAHGKGRSGWKFFCLSMLFSPAVGFLVVLLASPLREIQEASGLKSGALKKCPFCFEIVSAGDVVCRFCSRPLPEIIDVAATVDNDSSEVKPPRS